MPENYPINTDIFIDGGKYYKIHPHHRRRKPTKKKSVWVITHAEEVNCFQNAVSNACIDTRIGFGFLKSIDGSIKTLGINADYDELKISKFVSDDEIHWHGYPADYFNHQHDTPTDKILIVFRDNKLIDKTQLARILGRACKI